MSVDRAAEMVHAAGVGVVLTLLAAEPEDRDPTLSSQLREAVLSAITAPAPRSKRSQRRTNASRHHATRAWARVLRPYPRIMPAYVIAETDVHDPERYERYRAAVPDTVAAGGGRFIARGGELAVLEGDWRPERLVLLEFDDLEAAKRWYESPEYQEVKRLRDGAATLRVVAVEGL